MKKLIYIFILLFSYVFAENITLKEKLTNSKKGDFIVYEHNKIYSLLSIFDMQNETIILEEITIPKNKFNKNLTFTKWAENKAKKHTSWTIYEIDLKKNKIINAFSVSRNCFINLMNNESLITALLDLKLKKLDFEERKKIGPPPQTNEMDRRAIWNPTKIVNSKKIKKPFFHAFRSIWPDDGSEFAYKIFDIYFDDSFCFPYFIDINNGHISYIIKAIDSGTDLKSNTYFPRKKLNK